MLFKRYSYFSKMSMIWVSIFYLLIFCICLIISIVINDYSLVYAILLSLPFSYIYLFTNELPIGFLIKKAKMHKSKTYLISWGIILFCIKYLIILIPLIIGLAIDYSLIMCFNQYVLIICVLFIPLSSLISQWFVLYKTKKQERSLEKSHASN